MYVKIYHKTDVFKLSLKSISNMIISLSCRGCNTYLRIQSSLEWTAEYLFYLSAPLPKLDRGTTDVIDVKGWELFTRPKPLPPWT